ncbi:hypothetical protein D3C84_1217860 [compost metagenome]
MHAEPHQLGQALRKQGDVLRLGHVELQPGGPARALEAFAVEGKQRVHQIPGQGRGQLAQVSIPYLLAHLVMHVAERIG